jgi:hypothetical protein
MSIHLLEVGVVHFSILPIKCIPNLHPNPTGETMRFLKALISSTLLSLMFAWSVCAQENIDREVDIHRNVKLYFSAASPEIPAGITSQYLAFLPMLESVLKENIVNQTDDCALTIKVSPIVREIGSVNKTKRAVAKITAYRKNAKQEFSGNLFLYSFINSDVVSKEETQQFLKRNILDPAECK